MKKFAAGLFLGFLLCLPVLALPPHPATAVIGDIQCQIVRESGTWSQRPLLKTMRLT